MWAQRLFIHKHEEIFHFYQNKHHWCSCKVCIGVAIIDWSQHHCMSSQYNKNITISHFDIYHHILIISMLHDWWVYGLISMLAWYLWVILIKYEWLKWVNVGNINPSTKIGLLGKLGVNEHSGLNNMVSCLSCICRHVD
jgi:hypothetical protein